jgi:hypothetical protein
LSGGFLAKHLQGGGMSPLDSYRTVLLGYALVGGILALVFMGLSKNVKRRRKFREPP